MSSFWSTILDWFLPNIRLSDDIYDIEASRITNRIAHSHQRSLGSAPPGSDATGRYRDRKSERTSRRDIETDAISHGPRTTPEQDESRRLRGENELLRQKVAQLQSQLADPTRLTLSTKVSPPRTSSTPVSPTSTTLLSPPSSSSPDYKSKYDHLQREYDIARSTLNNCTAELSSLRSFLSKTDAIDNASILQKVQDLNTRLQQFAANVVEAYHGDLPERPGDERKSAVDPEHLDAVKEVVGGQMVKLLMSRDHVSDPMLLQYALQAWEVGCVSLVLDPFCFGAPRELDHILSVIFKRMHVQEPVATAARWRALTHTYLKGQLSPSSDVPPTPVTPTSDSLMPSPNEDGIQRYVDHNLAGLQVLLVLSGSSCASHSFAEELREKYALALRLMCKDALEVANSLREAFMSQLLETVVIPPAQIRNAASTRRNGRPSPHVEVENHATRYNATTMEDVLPLPLLRSGDNLNNVLCTVELGLAAMTEKEQPWQRAGRKSSDNDTRPASRSATHTPQAISRTTSSGEAARTELVRQIMLKPKVLLASFVNYFDHEQQGHLP